MSLRLPRLFVLGIALALTFIAQPAGAAVELHGNEAPLLLAGHISYFEDASALLSVTEVAALDAAFRPFASASPNFGYSRSAYWLRFRLASQQDVSGRWLLNVGKARLHHVSLYLAEADGYRRIDNGYVVPIAARPVPHRELLFAVDLEARGARDVFLRVESQSSLQLPVAIWNAEAFAAKDRQQQLVFGLYYGLLLAMAAYNFFLFFAVRDRSYLYYVLYVLSFSAMQFTLDGLASEMLWPFAPTLSDKVTPFAEAIALLAACVFTRHFLETRRIVPRLDVAIRVTIAVALLASPLSLFVDYRTAIIAATFVVIPGIIVVVIAAAVAWRSGYRPARYFLLAWAWLTTGAMLFALSRFAVVPANFVTLEGIRIGSALELLLLSFALADRINILRQERAAAQAQTLAGERAAAATQRAMAESFVRFVPREFLQLLGRDDPTQIQLGDHTRRSMAVLFSDIHAFTALSETMTPEENFRFINGYLGMVTPVIRKHTGFVDKYIGDGIMALFPGHASDALAAAIGMHLRVEEYNRYRQNSGYRPINIGVGIHSGRLMLGTIGVEDRMEGTVISDAVNTAARIERLTRLFGARVLMTGEALAQAEERRLVERRFLGRVKLRGKQELILVYDILAADHSRAAAAKALTRARFEVGIEHYIRGEFADAAAAFREALARYPEDSAAKFYRDRSVELLSRGNAIGVDWDGSVKGE